MCSLYHKHCWEFSILIGQNYEQIKPTCHFAINKISLALANSCEIKYLMLLDGCRHWGGSRYFADNVQACAKLLRYRMCKFHVVLAKREAFSSLMWPSSTVPEHISITSYFPYNTSLGFRGFSTHYWCLKALGGTSNTERDLFKAGAFVWVVFSTALSKPDVGQTKAVRQERLEKTDRQENIHVRQAVLG